MNAVAENLKFNFKRWYSNIHIRYLASLHFHSSLEIYACTSTIALYLLVIIELIKGLMGFSYVCSLKKVTNKLFFC